MYLTIALEHGDCNMFSFLQTNCKLVHSETIVKISERDTEEKTQTGTQKNRENNLDILC